jgi:5-methyltetrahydropteroyltriglutamate--homocysteine methyltransferase
MKLFPTQEIGSLPKATPETMGRWAERIRLPAPSPTDGLPDARSRFNLAFLHAAGLDIVYDGEAHRIEMAEHPYRSIVGAEFVGHVRSFDNKYFRKAAIRQVPGLKAPYHSDEYRFVRSIETGPVELLKVPVTGSYTLAEWAYNDHYLAAQPDRYRREGRERAQRELVVALARHVVRPTVADLVRLGARSIQIDEPALGTHPRETALAVEGFEESVRGLDAEFAMHLCFSNYDALLPELLEAKSCREWLWEFANRDVPGHDAYKILADLREYGDRRRVGAGVLDVHRDEVETPERIADRIRRAARYLGDPSRIWVNPDCGLRTRRLDVARAKLEAIVAGAALARADFERPARHLGDPSRLRVNPDCGLRTRSWEVIWAKLRAMVAGVEQARRAAA